MGTEIERKFLVCNDSWKGGPEGKLFRQGYICNKIEASVRVRISGQKSFLTIKGQSHGMQRAEFEFPIPLDDATALLDSLCEKPIIEKTRYLIEHDGNTWELDVFHGENDGLIMAEIELPSEDAQFSRPGWAGEEVTDDTRYYNVNLVANPYSKWKK